ncbi:MAG: hypothetical protein ABI041_11290, partial [Bdellovibrionia bacterium]
AVVLPTIILGPVGLITLPLLPLTIPAVLVGATLNMGGAVLLDGGQSLLASKDSDVLENSQALLRYKLDTIREFENQFHDHPPLHQVKFYFNMAFPKPLGSIQNDIY